VLPDFFHEPRSNCSCTFLCRFAERSLYECSRISGQRRACYAQPFAQLGLADTVLPELCGTDEKIPTPKTMGSLAEICLQQCAYALHSTACVGSKRGIRSGKVIVFEYQMKRLAGLVGRAVLQDRLDQSAAHGHALELLDESGQLQVDLPDIKESLRPDIRLNENVEIPSSGMANHRQRAAWPS
jgi:hypothetical protein